MFFEQVGQSQHFAVRFKSVYDKSEQRGDVPHILSNKNYNNKKRQSKNVLNKSLF